MNPTRINASPDIAIDRFDLLPPSFYQQNRVREVSRSWIVTICMLIAVLGGVTVATLLRTHRQGLANVQIAITAIPLMNLRRDVLELQAQNVRRVQWCDLAEASRPDDSALQTIAAIAVASQNGNRNILIDSLHVRLPVEYPETESSVPSWAIPKIEMTARAITADASRGWVDRLNSLDRIESASISVTDRRAGGNVEHAIAPLRLIATPRATRVLP